MEIFPAQIIGYRKTKTKGSVFYGYNPETGKQLTTAFPEATPQEIQESIELAHQAFQTYRKIDPVSRSLFLKAIAENIDALGDDLLEVIHEETALPLARLAGEKTRTTGQLRLFAELLTDGKWNSEIFDHAMPDRKPVPRPEMRLRQIPLGVVAVFGAANFPLAFSVAGGDTASALAAGCPVVFKAHPAHPATCQLIGEAIVKAASETGMPEGVFSLLHGITHETGGCLVMQPRVRAIAFTGSFKGGKALFDLAVRRKEPIPVYAEMGSVNPVIFLPEVLHQHGEALAVQFAQSVTLGAGQFCTNPGLCIMMNNEESKSFIQNIAASLSVTAVHPLLTKGIEEAYIIGLERQRKLKGARELITKTETEIKPCMISVYARDVLQEPVFFEEVFGPSTVAILAEDIHEIEQLIDVMPGQLTGSIHAAGKDFEAAKDLIEKLTQKVGRVVLNGFPTGVEVCHAMMHGGPYPATTDSRVTSVGTTSIYRFTRPVCYQNIPASLLPPG